MGWLCTQIPSKREFYLIVPLLFKQARINYKILKLPIKLNLTTLNINHYSRLTIVIQCGFKQRLLCFASIINVKNKMRNLLQCTVQVLLIGKMLHIFFSISTTAKFSFYAILSICRNDPPGIIQTNIQAKKLKTFAYVSSLFDFQDLKFTTVFPA